MNKISENGDFSLASASKRASFVGEPKPNETRHFPRIATKTICSEQSSNGSMRAGERVKAVASQTEKWQRRWIGIDLSPKAVELVKMRLARDLDLTEDAGLLGDKVIHRTDRPECLVPDEPRQIHAAPYSVLRTARRWRYRKLSFGGIRRTNTLFGLQEVKCTGCEVLFPFRNMTIDHILPRSKGGTDAPENLQLLCGACNSTKGSRTQEELIASLRDQGVLREYIQGY